MDKNDNPKNPESTNLDNFDNNGRFVKSHKIQKPKGATNRHALTNKMIERFAERNQEGISVEDILFDIAQDPMSSIDMKFKSAAKLADLVYPKAQSVEVTIDQQEDRTPEEIDQRIIELLNKQQSADLRQSLNIDQIDKNETIQNLEDTPVVVQNIKQATEEKLPIIGSTVPQMGAEEADTLNMVIIDTISSSEDYKY